MKNRPRTKIILFVSILLLCSNGLIPALADTVSTAPAAPTGLLAVQKEAGKLTFSWNANSESDLKYYCANITTTSTVPKKLTWITLLFPTNNECTISCHAGDVILLKVAAINESNQTSSFSSISNTIPAIVSTESTSSPVSATTSTESTSSPVSATASTESTSSPASATASTESTSSPASATASTESTSSPASATASTESTSSPASATASTEPTSSPVSATASAESTSSSITSTTANISSDTSTSSTQTITASTTDISTTKIESTITQTTIIPPTIATPPAAPTELQIRMIGNQRVTLSWKSNSETDLKGYYISYQSSSDSWTPIFTVNNSFCIDKLTNNTMYSFKVNAVNNSEQLSQDSTVLTATPTSDISSQVVLLGTPFSKRAYAKNVWDMQLFNGKIYLGHGDAVSDAGPIPIIYYDPQTGKFVNEYTTNEEQIDVYKIMDGILIIPGTDARDDWSFANFYKFDGIWSKFRTIPIGTHVFDMASYKGKLYAAVEEQSHDANLLADIALTASSDGGKTWISQMPSADGLPFGSTGCIGRTLFELNGKLYCIGTLIPGETKTKVNNILVTDGTTSVIQKATNMLPGSKQWYLHRILRPTHFNNQLVYLGVINVNGCQWSPDSLYAASDINQARKITLPESNSLPVDILVRDNTCYVLAYIQSPTGKYTNIVYKSDDLNNWAELFRFNTDTYARSFEESNGDFYFGLGCNADNSIASTGNILKIGMDAYN